MIESTAVSNEQTLSTAISPVKFSKEPKMKTIIVQNSNVPNSYNKKS